MRQRLRVEIRGAVQGVGFRPFVYRLAGELSLDGWVVNDNQGVTLEVEGVQGVLERFLERLSSEKPLVADIQSTTATRLPPLGHRGFEIKPSEDLGDKTVQVLPDIATCPTCLGEVLDPAHRRHRYPFTNCTYCGPRFSIILSLPYDRPRTTMKRFVMCEACRTEYETPADRRFHAQPNACPACGPRLALWNAGGEETAMDEAALRGAVSALERGEIVAVKGLGGFHLMVDARNGEAVARLRARKVRREKPLALMVRDLAEAERLCRIGEREAAALSSPEAPILLVRRREGPGVQEDVARGNPYLGIMLPYTPLHHLILRSVNFPVVATSGNLSDEPICTDEREAVRRLGCIPDLFLVHDRPIARHLDDSIAWVVDGKTRLLRRARGFAPRPVLLQVELPVLLAVGAHLKNTVALSNGRQVFISQHIGDMETPEALAAFEAVIGDFLRLYEAEPAAVAHDLHPDYATTRWAQQAVAGRMEAAPRLKGLPLIPVQHHHAHLAGCLVENASPGPALGVTWDGTGHGADGTVWGGELLLGTASSFRRVAHLRTFHLPGGEAAVREPRRSAVALLWELLGEAAMGREDLESVRSFRAAERNVLVSMLARGVNCPLTSSAGRLFDGVAALVGLMQRTTFEGQAAMALEFVADLTEQRAYPMDLVSLPGGNPAGSWLPGSETPVLVLDWRPLVEALLEDLRRGEAAGIMAARFHNALADVIVCVAQAVGERRVALSGGCFQNRLLTERSLEKLRSAGFEVLLHRQVPPNDGGISLGQIAVAASRLRES